MAVYDIRYPTAPEVPIVISSPHSGVAFPDDIRQRLHPEMAARPDDADWFIDRLYDFAPAMGITFITAHYCRWVIDLNRDPKSIPLYNDGRVITGLVPLTDFNGRRLYEGAEPDQAEIERRVSDFYEPYHQKVGELLEDLKARHGKVLLFDAHSIRKVVPGIQEAPFPDLILGDNDGSSAGSSIISTAYDALQRGGYELEHNTPFKGGYITRFFGQPDQGVHALQLEMAKTNYMDDTEMEWHPERAAQIRQLLVRVFESLITELA